MGTIRWEKGEKKELADKLLTQQGQQIAIKLLSGKVTAIMLMHVCVHTH